MKKIYLLFIVCVSFLILVGCYTTENDEENPFYLYDYNELKSNVTSVELIYYHNEDNNCYDLATTEFNPFDFSKMEVLDVLPERKLDTFYSELIKVKSMKGETFWYPTHECVKINYIDCSFDILDLSVPIVLKYDSLGNTIKYNDVIFSYSGYISNFIWFFDYTYLQEYD